MTDNGPLTNGFSAAPAPALSVIIPTFNAAHRLEGVIAHVNDLIEHSGVPTKSAHVEVIVVDDGSTDQTKAVLGALSKRYRFRVVHQENTGVSGARNAGIRASASDVIGMLDVDDRWTEAIFDELLPTILRPDSAPIVQGRLCDQWDEGLGPSYESVNLGTALFRRSVFGTVGLFNERLRRLEDYEWFLRAFDFRVPKTRTDCTALNYLRRTDGLTGSAPTPDPLFVRVHRGAAARRRAGLAPAPPGFPTPQEYFGVAPSEAERRPRQPTPFSCTPSATTISTALTRIDTRTIDDGPGVRAFLCVRNEGMRLRALLDHHRKLGVVSFFIIDNESTDGSTTWMMEEPDVYVWRTTGSFQEAQFGTRWMLSLIDAFGRDRWCLVVDADELLIVPKGDRETLDDYCEALDREDANAVLAVMVDMYPYGELRNAQYRPGENPLHLCRWFDRNVWTTKMPKFFGHQNHESFFGGVRERVFGSPSRHETHTNSPVYYTLNKVPLFKFTTGQRFSPSFHWVDGARMSTSRCALLHWKFTANLSEKVVSEVQREEHWDGASQYKRYANALINDGGLSLFDPSISVEFRGPDQLIELGIMRAIERRVPKEDSRKATL